VRITESLTRINGSTAAKIASRSVAQILVQALLYAQQTILSRDEAAANGFGKTKVYQSPLNFIWEPAQRWRYRNDF
jgi:hypothetical protein